VVNFVVAVLLVVLGVAIALRLRQVRYEKLAEAERRVHRARIAWRLGRRVSALLLPLLATDAHAQAGPWQLHIAGPGGYDAFEYESRAACVAALETGVRDGEANWRVSSAFRYDELSADTLYHGGKLMGEMRRVMYRCWPKPPKP
jgi:hypothetical protein